MAWSTRELADLAGTSVRAVRHYHHVGLLAEPQRRANGYKQYGVAHLVRVLRIKRLADLGFTLPQIAELGDADQHPRDALRGLDAHLARTLDRLQDARSEIQQILQQAAPTDIPPALAARIRDTDVSDADRALLIVLTRVLGLAVVTDFVDTLRGLPPSPAATAFDQLPADADDATRHELATRLLPRSRTLRVMLPRLRSATDGLSAAANRTVDVAARDLYNPAQFDVLRRVELLLRSRPGPIRIPQVGVAKGSDRVTGATPLGLTVPQRHGVHSGVITAVAPSRTPGRP
ncbi:MerR family transcriptional regulator [Pseudonocardia kunmingensis]|uniref:DNA-binding transcriptional MerR regulator n=1 Tax=Pseudonocardia kunmingensis TaxID=630975 RepID=A0A543DJ00_9PSEU|nr:MerR family transcriptional regulator [Pseudonocardia kunmingensis]TQM09309.1 DNA-binding transcriptional MerR regulator [Pseudonocardia kunmingensis]